MLPERLTKGRSRREDVGPIILIKALLSKCVNNIFAFSRRVKPFPTISNDMSAKVHNDLSGNESINFPVLLYMSNTPYSYRCNM